jgi:hypothetical protein
LEVTVRQPADHAPHLIVLPPRARTAPAMELLAGGVPLSLLMDLAEPLGPDSIGILHNESTPNHAVALDAPVSATAS